MILLPEWKDYRAALKEKNRQLDDLNEAIFEKWHASEYVERRFLWWTWTAYAPHFMPPLLHKMIPPTVEGCLDWLVNGRKFK